MSKVDLWLYAWCDEPYRVDAFAAALHAARDPYGVCNIWLRSLDHPGDVWRETIPIDEAIAEVRAAFAARTHANASVTMTLGSGRCVSFGVDCYGEGYERRFPSGPLCARPSEQRDLCPSLLEIASGSGTRTVEVEAVIAAMQLQSELDDLLVRFCTPYERTRVTTGAWTFGNWHAPIEMCATYHADATEVARDLALSWLHLHDGDMIERAAGLSLAALAAGVEAAPAGACVGVAGSVERVREHLQRDRVAARSRDARPTRADAVRSGPRAPLPGDVALTREQVLAALATPPGTLLEALEASAVPDDAWRAVEAPALELIEAKAQGAPTYEVDVSTGKHTRFIERHAPYHVRRLPTGGVLLATHPYRTLFPLWADALFLLGIRP